MTNDQAPMTKQAPNPKARMSAKRTGLLVSVRSAEEARLALAGGADVIDIKEPSRGALGPADSGVWEEVAEMVGQQAVTSAALGELLADGIEDLAAAARSVKLVKIGLAGCHQERGWLNRWFDVTGALDASVLPVPVSYADWPAAAAPSPSVALALAAQSPAKLLLVDTHDKTRGGLLAHFSFESLAELVQTARGARVRVVLAGSLDAAAIGSLLPLAPAYIGVRGAACRGGREGTLDEVLVKSLASLVHGSARKAAG
jgi:(5-formylfuran-3-yl)methyl phosphate synthase